MRNHKLLFSSSYDRGLDILLYIWPDVLEKFPDAELSIAYGWDLYDKVTTGNQERKDWKRTIETLMQQKGITHYGRVGKEQLNKLRQEAGIWAYPTYFSEIFCISAVEAQLAGCVPVTMDLAALDETVQSGVKVSGDIRDPEVQKVYLEKLLYMMGNEPVWELESLKAKQFAKNHSWKNVAKKWATWLDTDMGTPLVTIYTPTVRDGWWNVMANNIANQTYEKIQWVIVDDSGKDRSRLATKYANLYNLRIDYTQGKKRKTNRTYSLCNANNTAIEKAEGEVFVFLQDFVLMPEDGIEKIVDLYRHHPNDFLAVCDKYHAPKVKPNTANHEDWFDGNTDVVGAFMRKNIRVQNKGIRSTDNIQAFEQNYGAVATKVLRELGGYYEFFDEALGWDDTEIIYRGALKGHKCFIDDGNIATCIDHWGTLGKDEGGKSVNRTRRLNDPRYFWMVQQIKEGKLPVVRTQEVDDKIDLQYTIPTEVSDEDCVDWMRKNTKNIIDGWS